MAGAGGCCGVRTAVILLLLSSAIPLSLFVYLERTKSSSPSSIEYLSHGWLRECAKWDPPRHRFIVSTILSGVVVEIPFKDGILEERVLISDEMVAGNASLGITVDEKRGRFLVVYADVLRLRYSAVAAYDLESGARRFLTQLSGQGDGDAFADDVAVDEDGNAYITDAKGNKIWKVGLNGELLSTIRSEVFKQKKEWYYNLVGLNGIVYHPNGYLLVIHTFSGHLFKVDITKEEVSIVQVKGSLFAGDGLELFSPSKLVVAGTPSARLVESSDDWKTATVTARYMGPMHRVASSATVKDGKVFLGHIFGGGITKWTHVIVEAVFSPLNHN